MDLRLLKIFLMVSRCNSFTIAAKRLGKTQSAISQAIRQLEDGLGVVLVNRVNRPMTLTPAGALLREHACQLIEDAEVISNLVRSHGNTKMHEIRIGLVDSLIAASGPEIIKLLLGYAVNLVVWSGLTSRLADALIQRKLDVIISNDALEEVDGLSRYELLREPYVLLLPASICGRGTDINLALLARNYPMIHYNKHSFLGMQIERKLRQSGIHTVRRLSVDTTESLVEMTAAGIGWTITSPLCLLQGRPYLTKVMVLPFPNGRFFRRLFLVARNGEYPEVQSHLAKIVTHILATNVLVDLRKIIPWLGNQITVTSWHET